MPVPVASTHRSRAPMDAQQNTVLETAGPFARRVEDMASMSEEAKVSQTHGRRGRTEKEAVVEAGMESSVLVNGLTFRYPGIDGSPLEGVPPVIQDMHMSLPPGSRCLLVGPNGAGKTTLLKVLGGKHMVQKGSVSILGHPPFHNTDLTTSGDLAYVGGNWERDIAFAGYSIPLQGDFPAQRMLDGIPGVEEARKQRMMEVMDINPNWRMHLVSDGQRRRVQIACGLLHPFKVLLLDEITVDLDVLGRADLMNFLRQECEARSATVIYATHIFDGLEAWPTHIAYVAKGRLQVFKPAEELPELRQGRLLELIEGWLREEKLERERLCALEPSHGEPKADFKYARNNGWAPGRIESSLKLSTNTVLRM